MRIQPRQQLLEVWQAMARSVLRSGRWEWGGRDAPNSISDAEQLLCLMMPATDISSFRLDRPDQTAEDILHSLRSLGDSVDIPRQIIRLVGEYLERYTDGDGTPIFGGGSYFDRTDPDTPPSEEQKALDVVDSFSMSVSLMLGFLGFLKVFRSELNREDLLAEITDLEGRASRRLTAAIVSLLRSFAISTFDPDSVYGERLVNAVNQTRMSRRAVVDQLREGLRETKAGLRDLTVGVGEVSDLDNPNRLFECGWSWGIVKEAPEIGTDEPIGKQREGVAESAPYLYFTVVALDGIEDLFSERTRILRLLNDEQLRLARLLQLRWDLTQQYWSAIASFGPGRWPLEDLPWRTLDGVESDYFSLLVTSVMVQDLPNRRTSDTELARVGAVLEELANRARITRRPFVNDQAVLLHSPGQTVELVGTEERGASRLAWTASDLAPLLLKRTIRVARLMSDIELRGRLLSLADQIWAHLDDRRIKDGTSRSLWDQPADAFPGQVTERSDKPSWYFTSRVVQCLVAAANIVTGRALTSERLAELVSDLLSEADHLYDQELLSEAPDAAPVMREALRAVEHSLRRARAIVHDRPGTAVTRAFDALRQLDDLAAARQYTTDVS